MDEYICIKCGTPLSADQEFCPKCGTKKGTVVSNARICSNCGATLQEGQEFCSKCGQKSETSSITSSINEVGQTVVKPKKALITIVTIVAVVLIIAVVAIIAIVKTMPKVEDLTAIGDYNKAYNIAKDDEKALIMRENAIAVAAADAANGLKDRSSFQLGDAWINDDYDRIVLNVSGQNGYGGVSNSYWYYTYDTDEKSFSLFTTYSSLEEEETNSWDDADDILEKTIKNIFLDTVKEIISSGEKLPRSSIKNINKLFNDDILDDVKLLEDTIVIASAKKEEE